MTRFIDYSLTCFATNRHRYQTKPWCTPLQSNEATLQQNLCVRNKRIANTSQFWLADDLLVDRESSIELEKRKNASIRYLEEQSVYDDANLVANSSTIPESPAALKDTLVNGTERDQRSMGSSQAKRGIQEKRQIHRGNVKRGGSVANWLTDWFAEMKANTEPGNTMGGVRIAYQVDSRHSRVKWIGPYEAG